MCLIFRIYRKLILKRKPYRVRIITTKDISYTKRGAVIYEDNNYWKKHRGYFSTQTSG